MFTEAHMFERVAVAAVLVAGLLGGAALATPQPPAETPKAERICRGGTRQLGSHTLTPRRCRTAEQWRMEDEERDQAASNLRLTEGQNDGRAPRAPQ